MSIRSAMREHHKAIIIINNNNTHYLYHKPKTGSSITKYPNRIQLICLSRSSASMRGGQEVRSMLAFLLVVLAIIPGICANELAYRRELREGLSPEMERLFLNGGMWPMDGTCVMDWRCAGFAPNGQRACFCDAHQVCEKNQRSSNDPRFNAKKEKNTKGPY